MLPLKKGYDKIEGEYYTRSRLFRWWHINRFKKAYHVVSDVEDESIIVDLGCDGGNFTQTLLDFGDVVGVDISTSFIEAGKRCARKVHFIMSDVEMLPLRGGSSNLVTCMEVLEHLQRPEQAVSESWRILKPDGRFFISIPDVGKRLWRIIWFFWQNIGRGTAWRHKHIHNFDREKLIQLIHPFFTEIVVDYVNFFLLLVIICRKQDVSRIGD
jgi:2-polyprenyl-3-methyl-5-hydroxy-6-metoxy-1,4-benzoquinol methylase